MYLLKFAEKAFFLFSFLYFSEALFSLSLFSNNLFRLNFSLDNIRLICNLFILIINIFLIIICYKQVLQLVKKEKLLWILMAIALFSVFWSVAPSLSIRRFFVLFNATLSGIYLAARYTIKEQINLLFWTLTTATIVSFLVIMGLPELGIMSEETHHPGAWQGIFLHKNALGLMMVLSALVSFLEAKTNPRYFYIALIVLSLSILLLIGSTSKNSLVIFGFFCLTIAIYQLCQWFYKYNRPAFTITIFITIFITIILFLNTEVILELMGRNSTLTGRTGLWEALLDKIWVRPWLGYGYGAFWQSTSKEYLDVWREIDWKAHHGHNGFLDLWLELGLLGLSVFTLNFIYNSFCAIKKLWSNQKPELLFSVSYLLFLLLANLAESSLLGQKSLWLLYVNITLSIYKNNTKTSAHSGQTKPSTNLRRDILSERRSNS